MLAFSHLINNTISGVLLPHFCFIILWTTCHRIIWVNYTFLFNPKESIQMSSVWEGRTNRISSNCPQWRIQGGGPQTPTLPKISQEKRIFKLTKFSVWKIYFTNLETALDISETTPVRGLDPPPGPAPPTAGQVLNRYITQVLTDSMV